MYQNISFSPRIQAQQLMNAQAQAQARAANHNRAVMFGRMESQQHPDAQPIADMLDIKTNQTPPPKKPATPAKIDTTALKTAFSGLVDNIARLLQDPKVQSAMETTNANLAEFAQHKDLPPVEKVKLNLFRQGLPTSNEKLAQLFNRVTQGLQHYNNRLSRPNENERLLAALAKMNKALQSPEILNKFIQSSRLRQQQRSAAPKPLFADIFGKSHA